MRLLLILALAMIATFAFSLKGAYAIVSESRAGIHISYESSFWWRSLRFPGPHYSSPW
jgi:hypothetical protein